VLLTDLRSSWAGTNFPQAEVRFSYRGAST
jgi:hypothetical protein